METVLIGPGGEDSGLCLMVKGLLEEAVERHGGRLLVLDARIGIDTPDAAAQATLVLRNGSCTVEQGLQEPDLVLVAQSDLLAQLGEVPLRFGLPWLLSEAGRRLALRLLQGDLRLRRPRGPLRAGRAAVDLLLLFRLLAGSA